MQFRTLRLHFQGSPEAIDFKGTEPQCDTVRANRQERLVALKSAAGLKMRKGFRPATQ
jgi:hypothetical protein